MLTVMNLANATMSSNRCSLFPL